LSHGGSVGHICGKDRDLTGMGLRQGRESLCPPRCDRHAPALADQAVNQRLTNT
jgi:hypothetical protein